MSHCQTTGSSGADEGPYSAFTPDEITALFGEEPLTLDGVYGSEEQSSSYASPDTDCTSIFDDSILNSPFIPTGSPSDTSITDISSPDPSCLSFDPRSLTPLPSTYPSTPAPGTPHPYPLQLQQQSTFSLLPPRPYQPAHARPKPPDSQNHGHGQFVPSVLRSSAHRDRLHPGFRRRSLSQSDADRIAATFHHQPAHPTNSTHPQFRRAISAAPDDGRRGAGTPRLPRPGAQYKPGHKKRRSNPPTSAPSWMQDSGAVDVNPGFARPYARIGTPLVGSERAPDIPTPYVGDEVHEAKAANGMRVQINGQGPVLAYMSREDQVRASARVIEIGAMAVVAKHAGPSDVSPKTQEERNGDGADVLKLVDQMESHLKLREVGDTAKGLRGCEMIREALNDGKESVATPAGQAKMETEVVAEDGQNKANVDNEETMTMSDSESLFESSPEVMAADTPETFISSDGQDLLTLLQNDLVANGYEVDGA